MHRRYNRYYSRFEQPHPYDGSYDLTDPQSLNRYTYAQNDPVNFTDPSGLFRLVVRESPRLILGGSGGGRTGADMFLTEEAAGTELGGDGIGGGSQNTGQRSSNPNCIMNAVSGATSLARPFGNVAASGRIGHDGVHVMAPPGSTITTLNALTGTVIGNPRRQGTSGADAKLFVLDVLLSNGNVAIYKDLATVNVRDGQRLTTGTVIGTLGPGSGESEGLHFAILRGRREELRRYRNLTARITALDNSNTPADWGKANQLRNQITVNMFINPLGANSPVNCPGVPVNNAGVNPYRGG